MVMDDEKAIVSTIEKYLPKTDVYRCWNHVFSNVKQKLRNLGISDKSVLSRYVSDARELLEQNSELSYSRLRNEFSKERTAAGNR